MLLTSVAAELCLALAACWGAWRTGRGPAPIAPAGFLLFAVAAGLGALTYGGFTLVDTPHEIAARLAGWAGLALIAVGMIGKKAPMLLAAALLLAAGIATRQSLAVNVAALAILLLWRAWASRRIPWPTLAAGLLLALAELVIGTHGQVWGLPRVDLYHLALAAALLMILA